MLKYIHNEAKIDYLNSILFIELSSTKLQMFKEYFLLQNVQNVIVPKKAYLNNVRESL